MNEMKAAQYDGNIGGCPFMAVNKRMRVLISRALKLLFGKGKFNPGAESLTKGISLGLCLWYQAWLVHMMNLLIGYGMVYIKSWKHWPSENIINYFVDRNKVIWGENERARE